MLEISNEIKLITSCDNNYPKQFNEIKNKPKQIYVKGNIELLNKPGIAVIGSRKYSEYGMRMTKIFTKKLVEAGFVIISGMAIGIDRFAHEECIKNGGKTIAVMGSGFNNIYPEENKDLYHNILKSNGCIITEYCSDEKANSKNFPIRNRLISGLSIATLVIEANYRSGTSITAKFCIQQNKKLFCIPNSLESKNSVGVNNLIKNGAKLVTCADDIINEFEYIENKVKVKKNNFNEKEYKLSKIELEIYNLLKEKPQSSDELAKIKKMNISKINEILSVLELEDFIIKKVNNKYAVKLDE